MKKAKCGTIIAAVGICLVLVSMGARVSAAGLVPCGGQGEPECNPCHFFALADNSVKFVAVTLIPILATILIAIGGFLYLVSGDSEQRRSQARGILTWTILGLALAYAAFVILHTFLVVLAGDRVGVGQIFFVKETGFEIPCVTPTPRPPSPPPVGDGGQAARQGLVSSQIQAVASEAARSGVVFASNGDCGTASTRVSPDSNIREVAGTGYPMTVCSPSCGPTSGCGGEGGGGFVEPSYAMLKAIPEINAVDGCRGYTITSMGGGRHGDGSRHYSGRAFDISIPGGTWQTCASSLQRPEVYSKIVYSFFQCEGFDAAQGRNVKRRCDGGDGSIDHLHIEW